MSEDGHLCKQSGDLGVVLLALTSPMWQQEDMTWLLFIDESGHDHKNMPLEVRGGIALHVSKLWSFVQGWQRLEDDAFGVRLRDYGKEAKGHKLLDKDRLRWSAQVEPMSAEERRRHATRFLDKGKSKDAPTRMEFSAYGQACVEMARGAFDLLSGHNARVFASAIPKGARPPANFRYPDYLRKDHVFLFERFFYFFGEREAARPCRDGRKRKEP